MQSAKIVIHRGTCPVHQESVSLLAVTDARRPDNRQGRRSGRSTAGTTDSPGTFPLMDYPFSSVVLLEFLSYPTDMFSAFLLRVDIGITDNSCYVTNLFTGQVIILI